MTMTHPYTLAFLISKRKHKKRSYNIFRGLRDNIHAAECSAKDIEVSGLFRSRLNCDQYLYVYTPYLWRNCVTDYLSPSRAYVRSHCQGPLTALLFNVSLIRLARPTFTLRLLKPLKYSINICSCNSKIIDCFICVDINRITRLWIFI